MSRSKTCFWKLSSRELKTRKRRWRKRKTKNKFTNIFTGNLRQNKISWTTTAEAATMQQDKQKECDCIFFVVFSPNFITGFPWQRVDNVTKFQLFAEQLPLLSNSLSPSPANPASVLDRFELFAQFWATASAAARAKAKASKGRASKLHRKITSTCQTHRRPPWPKALRFNAVSPSLSLSRHISVPLPCLEETPVQRERQRILSIIIHSLRMQIELDLICCPTTTNCAHNFACTAPDWHLHPAPPLLLDLITHFDQENCLTKKPQHFPIECNSQKLVFNNLNLLPQNNRLPDRQNDLSALER